MPSIFLPLRVPAPRELVSASFSAHSEAYLPVILHGNSFPSITSGFKETRLPERLSSEISYTPTQWSPVIIHYCGQKLVALAEGKKQSRTVVPVTRAISVSVFTSLAPFTTWMLLNADDVRGGFESRVSIRSYRRPPRYVRNGIMFPHYR